MKFKYIFKIAVSNFTRERKKNIMSIILMVVSLTIFLSTTSLSSSMRKYFDKSIQNSVECRTLFVNFDIDIYTSEQIINMMSKYENISAAIPQESIRNFGVSEELIGIFEMPKIGENDGTIMVKGGNNNATPDVIDGRKFNDEERNVAIIPNKFIPDSRLELIDPITNSKGIDGKSLLGQEIECKFDDKTTYTFKVVGVFDFEDTDQSRNTVYIPYNDMEEIYQSVYKPTIESRDPIVVVVDDYKNVEKVIDELYKDGMMASTMKTFDSILPTFIDIFGMVVSIAVFLVSVITISINTIKIVKDREQEIGMLKAIGYSNNIILKILNLEIVLVGMIGFIISVMFSSGILFVIYRACLSQSPTSSVNITLDLIRVIIALLISVLIPLISGIMASIRIMKIVPSSAMKE